MSTSRLRAHLEVQVLEDRFLPAATLTATLTNGLLAIEGTNGNDTITVRQIKNTLSVDGATIQIGNASYPRISVHWVNKIEVHGLDGNDVIRLDSGSIPGQQPITIPTELWGDNGDDQIWGGTGPNTIHAGAGNDTLYAGPAGDVLYGGAGNDLLMGGPGNDSLYGGVGNDTLVGGGGRDVLHGGTGFNTYREPFDLSVWMSQPASVSDVHQNQSFTCQTLAALAADIRAGRDFSGQVIHQGGPAFDVLLTQKNQTVVVHVLFDGSWNDNDPQPAVDANGRTLNDYWTILMQRARLKLLGVDTSHELTPAQWSQADVNTGYLLSSVGNSIYSLTGQKTRMFFVNDVSPQTLSGVLSRNGMAVASTYQDPRHLAANTGLVPLHAYTAIHVYLEGDTWKIQLYNPWGVDGNGPPRDGKDDGFLTLTWAEFTESFEYISIVGA